MQVSGSGFDGRFGVGEDADSPLAKRLETDEVLARKVKRVEKMLCVKKA
jgi:hypothetical protein